MPYLKEDTYSMQNRSRLYGRAGEEVDILSDSAGISIVHSKVTGEKFAVLHKEITDEPINTTGEPEKKDQLEPPKASAVRRSGRLKPDPGRIPDQQPGQGSLF